eukprot:TRINITY_DN3015_c0_g1_i1.p1 TRINITY_DN3015_c0_g1~~TRINITY_DN3015_c0_g1_i1.p1  ORF type:complete len:505 (+),score=104.58 TRINITY_DN3015_c0_g1_i1:44-1558(+)
MNHSQSRFNGVGRQILGSDLNASGSGMYGSGLNPLEEFNRKYLSGTTYDYEEHKKNGNILLRFNPLDNNQLDPYAIDQELYGPAYANRNLQNMNPESGSGNPGAERRFYESQMDKLKRERDMLLLQNFKSQMGKQSGESSPKEKRRKRKKKKKLDYDSSDSSGDVESPRRSLRNGGYGSQPAMTAYAPHVADQHSQSIDALATAVMKMQLKNSESSQKRKVQEALDSQAKLLEKVMERVGNRDRYDEMEAAKGVDVERKFLEYKIDKMERENGLNALVVNNEKIYREIREFQQQQNFNTIGWLYKLDPNSLNEIMSNYYSNVMNFWYYEHMMREMKKADMDVDDLQKQYVNLYSQMEEMYNKELIEQQRALKKGAKKKKKTQGAEDEPTEENGDNAENEEEDELDRLLKNLQKKKERDKAKKMTNSGRSPESGTLGPPEEGQKPGSRKVTAVGGDFQGEASAGRNQDRRMTRRQSLARGGTIVRNKDDDDVNRMMEEMLSKRNK